MILVKVTGPKKEVRPKTAPETKSDAIRGGSSQPKPVKRPTTGDYNFCLYLVNEI